MGDLSLSSRVGNDALNAGNVGLNSKNLSDGSSKSCFIRLSVTVRCYVCIVVTTHQTILSYYILFLMYKRKS